MDPLPADKLAKLKLLMDAFYIEHDDSKLPEIFTIFDRNSNGAIEGAELQLVTSQLSGEKIPEDEINEMVQEADTNKNGVIDYNEFVGIMKKNREN